MEAGTSPENAANEVYASFADESREAIKQKNEVIACYRGRRESIAICGASRKRDAVLQFAGPEFDTFAKLGEASSHKFHCTTPGTRSPFLSEADALNEDHDYFSILSWVFRRFLLASPIFKGKALLFTLPKLTVNKSQ